jgi:hypothetical protein
MMFRVMSADPARCEGGKQDILAAIDGRPIGGRLDRALFTLPWRVEEQPCRANPT